ncbi:LysR substrate-binding domain-containing protein [Variovorax paradoxus]|uniref:LysR substrate-binding domain-containing protein n=1 Tax=Variovorax paradoxus TaxID=34073 RepID=UPI0029C90210|nr:LysR substrate-binding domain-containing protein [Variovorax paradoxus]WPH23408.1 LysR substrate-binding domain-containing protein [Variovorax paradoxus]
MTLKHIEAFRVVVQTGSMTEASRRLHTSQPQVSRLVSQLEAIIGFALFERSGTRLAPSLEGKRFFQDVEKAFAGLQGLESAASNIRTFGGDRLAVAAMARIAGGVLSQAVVRFKREHPETLVTIHSGAATTVDTWVSSGLCDLGLAILYGDDPPGMHVETLLGMDCVALLPREHRLARARQVRASDLDGEAFISFPLGSGPRERIDQVLAAAGVKTRTVLESDLGASVCSLVAAGLGVSVINPLAALEEQRNLDFEVRAFKPAITVRLALLLAPDAPHSRLVSAFKEVVREVIESELDHIRPYRS